MAGFALIVDLATTPGRRDAFVARARRHAQTTLASEAGCLRYDVLVPQDGADRVMLYELYASQADAEAHLQAAHTRAYVAETQDMILARPRTACTLVEG